VEEEDILAWMEGWARANQYAKYTAGM